MLPTIILASTSEIRAKLLRDAGLKIYVQAPNYDESILKAASMSPSDLAAVLSAGKACSIPAGNSYIIGADQVLEVAGQTLSKPSSLDAARLQLQTLRAAGHHYLHTAAAVAYRGAVIWQTCATVTLHMRPFSDTYLDTYLARNWQSIRWSVGAYKLEEEGARLFKFVDGDYFNVLGLPLLELLDFFVSKGVVEG